MRKRVLLLVVLLLAVLSPQQVTADCNYVCTQSYDTATCYYHPYLQGDMASCEPVCECTPWFGCSCWCTGQMCYWV